MKHSTAKMFTGFAFLFLMFYQHSAQARSGVQAECSLTLTGYGRNSRRPGLAAASLACNSPDGPVPFGINTTYLQQFATSFTGVEISTLPCQQYAADLKIPNHALFYLCGDINVKFVSTAVQDVWLADPNDTSLHMAALVAFGENATGTFVDSQFSYNSAGPAVVAMQNAEVLLRNTSITSSTSYFAVWAYAVGSAHLAVVDCQLVNGTSGGAGLVVSHTAIGSIINTTFAGNTFPAFLQSVVVAFNRSQLYITNSSFTHNLGTGVQAQNWSQVLMNECVFTHNQAEYGAAVVALDESNITMYANNISFNNASFSGGGVYLYGQTSLTMFRSILHGNTATQHGGAVYSGGANKVQIEACEFTSNRAAGAGGALASYTNTSFIMEHCIVGNNLAMYGGGLALNYDTICYLTNNSVTKNSAETFGGGVSVDSQAQVLISGCSFTANTADIGAAIQSQGQSSVTLNRSDLNFNNARIGGGVDAAGQSSLRLVLSQLRGNRAGLAGGALSCDEAAQVEIEDCALTSNQAGSGGGVSTTATSNLTMRYCFLNNNTAQNGGGLSISDSSKARLQSNNISSNAAAGFGGGIYALNEAQVILSSLLVSNQAGEYGGGMCLSDHATVSILPGSEIANNHAGMSGGGFAAMGPGFVASEVKAVAHNNTAVNNMDIFIASASLTLLSDPVVTGLVDKVGTDKGIVPVTLSVSGLHGIPVQGEIVSAYLNSVEPIDTSVSDSRGLVHMFIRVRKPPGKYTIRFQLHAQGLPGAWPTPNVTVEVRGCIKGEVTPSPAVCEDCLAGFYSLDPSKQVCDLCPTSATCPGGAAIIPGPGYWHSCTESTQMHRCPNPSACGQHNHQVLSCTKLNTCTPADHIQMQCSDGYMGNICGMCLDGYGLSQPFHCERCRSPAATIAWYVIGAFVMLLCVIIFCHVTLSSNISTDLNDPDTQAAEILHCLVLYSQRLLIVGELQIDWPATIAVPFKILAGFWSTSSGATVSTDCLPPSALARLPLAARRLVFYICVPVAMLVVLVIFESIYTHVRSDQVGMPIASITMVTIFFFLPVLLRTTFGLFACIPLDQQVDPPAELAAVGAFWVQDLSTQCYSGYHRRLAFGVGVPLGVMLCVVLPVFIAWRTKSKSGQLNDMDFRKKYGFLTKSYVLPSRCWWEAVVVLETAGLVAISVFGISLGPFYQCTMMIVVLLLLVLMQFTFKPYIRSRTKDAVVMGHQCLFVTTVAGASFLSYNSTQAYQVYGFVMGSVLLVVNLAYVVYMLRELYMVVQWRKLLNRMRWGIASIPEMMQEWKSSFFNWTAQICGCCIRPHSGGRSSVQLAAGGLLTDGPDV